MRMMISLTRAQLWGSDIFAAVHDMRSDDLGRTWSAPRPNATLDRRNTPDGFVACPCDMTPAWHAPTQRLLATGHSAVYVPGDHGALVTDNRSRRDVAYSVYGHEGRAWSEWRTLEFPDPDLFYWVGAGCTQRVDLPDRSDPVAGIRGLAGTDRRQRLACLLLGDRGPVRLRRFGPALS
jgi:hypothetical protein